MDWLLDWLCNGLFTSLQWILHSVLPCLSILFVDSTATANKKLQEGMMEGRWRPYIWRWMPLHWPMVTLNSGFPSITEFFGKMWSTYSISLSTGRYRKRERERERERERQRETERERETRVSKCDVETHARKERLMKTGFLHAETEQLNLNSAKRLPGFPKTRVHAASSQPSNWT